MTPEFLIILSIIALFSVVQSLFGMGILVFGTPTLLLMGYEFIPTLGYLLPASFTISLLQVLTTKAQPVQISRYLYLLCLPGIGAGLWLTEAIPSSFWTNILIGVTLLLSALIRISPASRNLLTALLKKHQPMYHLVMGGIHGLTNLGGAMLAILASGTNSDKEAIRYTIAHYYLTFSTIQILLIATVMGQLDILVTNLPTAVTSAAVYLLIGKRIFAKISNSFYNLVLTMFIAVYGVVIIANF